MMMVPAGKVALELGARFGKDAPPITSGLTWRVYAAKADKAGAFSLVKEDTSASPTMVLPPGNYIVHVGFGLANAVKPVTLRSQTVREVFDLPAGGLRLEGRVGDVRIPTRRFHSTSIEAASSKPGDRRPIAEKVLTGDVVMVPEGTYNIVSNYGTANSVVRSDIRVQAGKLTDITVTHRAAVITLKLVSEQRRRGARQYRVVGADARRRRDQGIDRRVSACRAGGRRISRHRPQRRPGL